MSKRNIQTIAEDLIPTEVATLFTVPTDVSERIVYEIIVSSRDEAEAREVTITAGAKVLTLVANGQPIVIGGAPTMDEILHMAPGEALVVAAGAGVATVDVVIGTADR